MIDEEKMKSLKSLLTAQVSLVTDKLTDIELAVLNNVVQLNMSPHNRIFDYEKVEELFTDNNGTLCHDEIKEALAKIVDRRLSKGES